MSFKPGLSAAALLTVLPHLALAQAPPSAPYYAMDPRSPLTPSANSPVQQQVLENYRTQLQSTQRSLMQQDPGGTNANSRAVTQQLNQFGGAPPSALGPAGPPGAAVTPGR
ncbi:MAG: hypothetical protein JO001_27465 [Alphaproteobacteria bacterium]|nr:hypothetical protein [Alphaproteobacteria bacterium]